MSNTHPQPTLLLECLQHVLSYLQFNQLPTLCALLRVNSTLFSLTAPILYSSPFAAIRANAGVWRDSTDRTYRQVQLLCLFFNELDPSLKAQLPRYSTYLVFDEEDEDEDDGDENGARSKAPAAMQRYFRHYRYHDHAFLVQDVIPLLFETTTQSQHNHVLSVLDTLFLSHCGDRVVSMCIPSTNIRRFTPFLPSLACLRRIEIHRIQHITEPLLEELVEWVEAHNQIHGTLRDLRIGGITDYYDFDMSDLAMLVRLPQAFKCLSVLDTRSWSTAWEVIDQVPVQRLERLVMDHGEVQSTDGIQSQFLQRCPQLKVMDLFVPRPDTFRELARISMELSDFGQVPTQHSPLSSSSLLPPIERLYISGDHDNLRNAVQDSIVGLCRTLRVFKATSVARQPTLVPSLTWGFPQSVHLPYLQELQLHGDIVLEFRFSLLLSCPNLSVLKLMVNGLDSCAQEGNPMYPILTLQYLQTLPDTDVSPTDGASPDGTQDSGYSTVLWRGFGDGAGGDGVDGVFMAVRVV
ncbi:hypothetical protein BGW38_004369 [Lunasporangiospora selenospora]|uniref:F-box domain-containing protein n=1 Tax=Lunasporangiospora selenospora TaxID=979761 RepID=A0A9P6G2U0_9FUNG|nr:hypothetical protein BGW38_004369 [Lunasporangiospora selenospora]